MLSLFALHSSNRFVHISEVERGLACDCQCVACGEAVVARLGEVRGHHFAHSSNAEPCESNYESDLHRYAKRLILEAGGLVVPLTTATSQLLGYSDQDIRSIVLVCERLEEEVSVGDRRPDLLAVTPDGVSVAIEIAYASFCDSEKRAAYEAMHLPALEIDLRSFAPSTFDAARLKHVLLVEVEQKTWVWPDSNRTATAQEAQSDTPCPVLVVAPTRLPEEIVTVHGRWISIKEFSSGDIALKAVHYDPEVVSVVRTVARSHFGRYRPSHHNWVIPRFRAEAAREQLRAIARTVQAWRGSK